jgi:hypothetical protein
LKDFLKENEKKYSDPNVQEKEGNFFPAYPVEFLEVFSYSDASKPQTMIPQIQSFKKEEIAFISYAIVIEGDSIHKIFASKTIASEFLEIIPYCRLSKKIIQVQHDQN